MRGSGIGRRTAARWTAAWAVCVLIVVISGVSHSNPAVALSSAGHWAYNHSVGAVFHLDGSTKAVDAEVHTPRLAAADQVLEDTKNGYVVDNKKSRVVVFGKSTLKVRATLSTGTQEKPVGVQTDGSAYLVYRHGGTIVRLGNHQTVVRAGGPLASPVATTDGTVWVQRGNDAICRLGSGDTKLHCVAHTPAGDETTLTTLDDRPAVVDTTAGSITEINSSSAEKPLSVHDALPAGSQVAATDAGGRLPAVVPDDSTGQSALSLIDTSTIGSGNAAASPITVPLGSDTFDTPVTAGPTVVLVDRTTRDVYTYDNHGRALAKLAVPGDGDIHAVRGTDGRVYVDNDSGTNTTVVDGSGVLSSIADKQPESVSPLGGPAARASSTVARPKSSTGAPSSTGKASPTSPSTPTTPTTPAAPASPSVPVAPGIPTGKPTGAPIGVDITPHSNGIVNVVWQSIGTGAHYVVQALPTGRIVCRSTVHSCNAANLPTGKRTSIKVYGTTAAGQVRAGVSKDPSTVIVWHWATAPTKPRALGGRTSLVATWHSPTNFKAGELVGWDVIVNKKTEYKVTTRRITLRHLKPGKLYQLDISAITQDPNGSDVRIAGDNISTFVRPG